MARIARLSDALINKIAAGEVVERPASVVKELCENAIDAGAKSIRIQLEGGGLRRIAITDDGHGMSREDALLAIERHATSKLRDLEGLFAIHTMGFRGEALPSIASVSRFALTTSEPGAISGVRLELEGGKGPQIDDAPAHGGTSITVEDLFFNTPARRKFLKREDTELKHCEDAVIRLALAHPEIAFRAEHEGEVLFTSAAGAPLHDRIADALGTEIHGHLVDVEDRRLGLSIRGAVASPDFTFNTARGVYTFVNRRYVRDRGINHALQRAYQDALAPGRQPVAVLFIEIDASAVDVNVHPQKLEVRFADPRGVHELVHAAVGRALRAQLTVPEQVQSAPAAQYAYAVERFLSQAQPGGGPLPPVQNAAERSIAALSFGQARPGINEAPPEGFFSALKWIGELGGRFWICEGRGSSLVVIDPHSALERRWLGRLRDQFDALPGDQPTLFDEVVEPSPPLKSALQNRQEALARLGIRLEAFGGGSLRVEGLPYRAEAEDAIELLTELAETLPVGAPEHVDAYAAPLRVLACHAAAAEHTRLGEDERRKLFSELDGADFGVPARHGAVVVQDVAFLELERLANR